MVGFQIDQDASEGTPAMRHAGRGSTGEGRLRRRDWLRVAGLAWLGAAAGLRGVAARAGGPGRIYLTAHLNNRTDLLAYNPDDGTWTTVVPDCDTRPRVSPDGTRVAFTRRGALWVAGLGAGGAAGGEQKVIDLEGASSGSPPVWSGDGTRLMLSPGVWDETHDRWVFRTLRIDADGGNRVDLPIPDTDGVHDWSPDGAWVVTGSSRNATLGWTLYRMRPDATDQLRLTEGGNPFPARFSPDGARILYDDGGSDEKRGAWVIGLDGQGARRIHATLKGTATSSCWAPDGRRIAVVVLDHSGRSRGDARGRLLVLEATGETRASYPLTDARTSVADMPDWR